MPDTDPRDDLTALDGCLNMLQWLADEPLLAIRGSFQDWVSEQVPGSEVLKVAAIGEPALLTGGVRIEGDEKHVRLARTGVAFAFAVEVADPSEKEHHLTGVFTWVGREMHTPEPNQQIWIDMGGDLAEFGADGALKERIYGAPLNRS